MRRHAIRAFLVAPIVAPAIAFAMFSLGATAFNDFPKEQLGALVVGLLVATISYGHAFVLGLPLALFLLRRGVPSIGASAFCGALIGALPLSLATAVYEIAVPLGGEDGAERLSAGLIWIGLFTTCGMLSGIVWWLRLDNAVKREELGAA